MGGGGGGNGHATSAAKSTSALALNPAHGMMAFLHVSFAVTIGRGCPEAGTGCFLSPSMAHLAGVSTISHCPVEKALVWSWD